MKIERWESPGARLTAPAVPRVELQAVIADAVQGATGLDATQARSAAAAVADSLSDQDVQEELALAFVRALQRAGDAYMQRDDIYEFPGHLDTAARVVVDALSDLLGRAPKEPQAIPPEEAATALADVSYPGVSFQFVNAPYPRVTARAMFPDTYHPEAEFPVTQYAVVRGDLVETAFAAVMAVLEHEAREAFLYRGERVFDVHRDHGETAGPVLRDGAKADSRRSYTSDIGPSARVRARRVPGGGS